MQNFEDLDVLRSTLEEHELDEVLAVDNGEVWLLVWVLECRVPNCNRLKPVWVGGWGAAGM